ncbi:hypothetical protein QBC47DRAFT_383305 [Echria macrotheca]|uniref:Uncharacterized protein n=1 Tax=Echria macrotheca TaxID=438768 RepID=A0AAJ0BBL9_9PEZI|nr:hypothetical protein QBC47DRAFT_383305 [Echria macrotheca]
MAHTVHTWSPAAFGGQTIPSRLVRIPKVQQSLLDQEEAWRATTKNVPKEVLEHLREIPTEEPRAVPPSTKRPPAERQSTPEKQPAAEKQSAAERQPTPPHKTPIQSPTKQSPIQSLNPRPNGNEEQADEEDEDEPIPIPWTPSNYGGPVPEAETETGKKLLSPSPEFEKSPSRPPRQVRSSPPPMSSQQSIDMEIQVPNAVTMTEPSVFRPAAAFMAAVLEPTPPSAQIIPSTMTEDTPAKPPEAKRQRLMKNIKDRFDEPSIVPGTTTQQSALTASLPRLSPTIPDSSVSVIPSTIPGFTTQATTSPGVELTSRGRTDHDLPPAIPPTPLELSSTRERLPPNGPPSQVPFTAFLVAYPDFKCSLNDFIRAVMCLKDLQDRRALPEFLYDDFVRVWCTEFVPYIESAVLQNPSRILSAIQYYNQNVGYPVYINCVLTRENIDNVLEKHADEARMIREELSGRSRPPSVERSKILAEKPLQRLDNVAAPKKAAATRAKPAAHSPELTSDLVDENWIDPPSKYSRSSDSRTGGIGSALTARKPSHSSTDMPRLEVNRKPSAESRPPSASAAKSKRIGGQDEREKSVNSLVQNSNRGPSPGANSVASDVRPMQQRGLDESVLRRRRDTGTPQPSSTATTNKSKRKRETFEAYLRRRSSMKLTGGSSTAP